jgi:hypothetical protein
VNPNEDRRSAWPFVAGMIAGAVLMAFVGANWVSVQGLSDRKAWRSELPTDQDEGLYDLCLANGGTKLSCDAQQWALRFMRIAE